MADDDAKRAILVRRARFVAMALAGAGLVVSTADCGGDSNQDKSDAASGGGGGTPQPCLSPPAGGGSGGTPQPCLAAEVGPPPDVDTDADDAADAADEADAADASESSG